MSKTTFIIYVGTQFLIKLLETMEIPSWNIILFT